MSDGKLTDVFIKEITDIVLNVWADPGNEDTISSVPGVTSCGKVKNCDTAYYVYIDPRYDVEWIKKEIIARVKIGRSDG
jgi:hypothetical protein